MRYVLEGSVRKAANRVRITGQLVDALTGAHLWADRFDGAPADIFDLQDEVTTSVVGAIAPKMEQAEIERARRKPTESLDAYDYFLRGIANDHEATRETNREALRLFYKAMELDPHFASAYGMAAWCFARRKGNGWMTNREQEVAEASRVARWNWAGKTPSLSVAMAFVWDATSFYVARFLLGAAEAGFFPGIILYLSYWFPAHRRAAITSLFMAAAPISVVLGSPISSALLELHGIGGLTGWQWLFILEAVPAVILGVVVLFYMTDRPEKAKWLPDDQRAWLVETMEAERAKKAGHASHSIWRGLADVRVLALSLVYFGTSAGLYTLSIWAPQIIKEFGLTNMQVGFINAIPPTVAVIAMYLWAWHSDRKQERTWHVVIACLAAAAGLALAGIGNTVVSVVAALTLVNIGISSAKPPLWIMPTMFLSGPAAATGIATINSIGNLGGFVGARP